MHRITTENNRRKKYFFSLIIESRGSNKILQTMQGKGRSWKIANHKRIGTFEMGWRRAKKEFKKWTAFVMQWNGVQRNLHKHSCFVVFTINWVSAGHQLCIVDVRKGGNFDGSESIVDHCCLCPNYRWAAINANGRHLRSQNNTSYLADWFCIGIIYIFSLYVPLSSRL